MFAREIVYLGEAIEGAPAADVLRWASDQFGRRLTFATGFGAEGCVIIDLIARHALPVDLFTLDTGLLFPETYELWQRLEERYGVTIRAVQPEQSVAEQARSEGASLWHRDPDRCCELRKIAPLRRALVGFEAWITAIRRDQTPDRAAAKVVDWDARFDLVKVNPLVSWSHDEVWSYARKHDVPTNPLHQRGFPSIGCWPCTSAVRPGEDPRSGRWRGRAKTECGLHGRLASASATNDAAVAAGK
ncbi:MAG: phosphoadenylyl-sulfate reductase [Acidobacteriota bacterium]